MDLYTSDTPSPDTNDAPSRDADEGAAWYDAVRRHLDRLTGHWKQRTTIMQIIAAEAAGEGWDRDSFWGRSNTCARSTFYKWKAHDPIFTAVLDDCRQAVLEWRQGTAADAITKTVLMLKEQSPAVTQKLLEIILKGRSEHAMVTAILGWLDRADLDTAVKQTHAIPASDINHALQQIYGDDE